MQSNQINQWIEENFTHIEECRPYIGASSIGHPCTRSIYYKIKYPDKATPRTARSVRITDTGHVMEDECSKWLFEYGFNISTLNPQGKQHGWSTLDGRFKGHVDGMILEVPKGLNLPTPMIWECKTANQKNFDAIVKQGVCFTKPIYSAQVHINMAYMNIDYTLITVINKNTSEMQFELVQLDKDFAQQLSDKATILDAQLHHNEMPARPMRYPEALECKFCDFAKECWG
jgi:hypothetical protein